MKHYYLSAVLFICLCWTVSSSAQGIYQFWGPTEYGGNDNNGTLYTTRFDGTGQRVRKQFDLINPGQNPGFYQQPVVYNDKLYGMIPTGGTGEGLIYMYDPATGEYSRAANLTEIGATYGIGSLTLLNGKMYGASEWEEGAGGGMIFEFNPATNQVLKKISINTALGTRPSSTLAAVNNKLYGLTYDGGANNKGLLFEYDPATGTIINRHNFSGEHPIDDTYLMVYNNRVFGMIRNGGTDGRGLLFEYNPATSTFSTRKNFTDADASYFPTGRLSEYNGRLFGITVGGGVDGSGTIFEYNPATFVYTTRVLMSQATGADCYSSLTLAGSKFYGITQYGGAQNEGVLFEYDPTIHSYAARVILSPSMGENPVSGMTLYDGKLYGHTYSGGEYNLGVLFEYTPGVNSYQRKVDLGGYTSARPHGNLVRWNNKLFGITSVGGTEGLGTIFEYDLESKVYTTRYSFNQTNGFYTTDFWNFKGLALYNNRFYGLTSRGGQDDKGVIFEFNPATGAYTKKFDLAAGGTAYYSWSTFTAFNNKLYAVMIAGGANGEGALVEYDPATNAYAEKVQFGGSFGNMPYSTLVLYNNRLFGTTRSGGQHGFGTLFEYNPIANGIIKRYDFDSVNGKETLGALTLYNNKLYGNSWFGGSENGGVIYEYDPATTTLVKKVDFGGDKGYGPFGPMTVLDDKLYGFTRLGGPNGRGVMFEYNPATNGYVNRINFSGPDGSRPASVKVEPVPAPTAEGLPGACTAALPAVINTTNANKWVPFTNATGEAVAEINANGNILGTVSITYYVHNGPVRKDGSNNFYLDRNIAIRTQFAPASPVSLRLYIRKTEFETLKNTPGSGIVGPGDLAVFKNSDNCSPALVAPATQIPSSAGTWGYDYVYTVNINEFSSFYFGARTLTTLPVRLLSFEGEKQNTANMLAWKAACTGNVDFTVQRSTDGVSFSNIGVVMAFVQDCENPFKFEDAMPPARAYYRLQMKEQNGATTYSSVILLDRSAIAAKDVRVSPNPTSGDAVLRITSDKAGSFTYQLSDVSGRVLQSGKRSVQAGITLHSLQLGNLPPGVYQVVYFLNDERGTVRLLRQ